MADDQKRTAPYVPWATFTNALDQLAKGMPSRIDRSVFAGSAWNVQTQLFIALRFLGLLKGEDEPTALLDDLVTGSPEERKGKLTQVIRAGYADLIAIDLTKATRNHFEETLGSLYNVSGDTRVKAIRFFLNAAEQVGISLSNFISPKDGKPGASRRPRASAPRVRVAKTGNSPSADKPSAPSLEHSAKPSGTSKTVSLVSGGTFTISATLDIMSLNPKDREFVFGFIDKMDEYAKA